MNAYSYIIAVCGLIIISYLYNLLAAKTGIPAVLLLRCSEELFAVSFNTRKTQALMYLKNRGNIQVLSLIMIYS